jgi:hypothetical protein
MSKHRDLLLAAGALIVVLIVLALGFQRLGPREHWRAVKADARRIEDLRSIAQHIHFPQKKVPATLAELPNISGVSLKDPVTQAPYEFHPKSGMAYELCATFATDSAPDEEGLQPKFWIHPKGRHCYELDATETPAFF